LISKQTKISEIVEHYPSLVEVMVEDYHFHCIGCFASHFENIEQGAMVHGMSNAEITKMIKQLNKLIKSSNKKS
jgi:hybrid cluster-associated redox disulfide protein